MPCQLGGGQPGGGPTVRATAAVTASVMAVLAAGCDRNSPAATTPFAGPATSSSTSSTAAAASSTPAASPSPQPADYTRLLIKARDILAPNDSYSAQPPTPDPNGTQGAEVLLTNQDQTRAVGDSIVILPNPAAAPSALQEAKNALGTSVTGGAPQPSPVGSGGTVVSGMSPDNSKAVTILLFTEGRGFARLEFDSAPGQTTPDDFVTDLGQKQDIALRVGLGG